MVSRRKRGRPRKVEAVVNDDDIGEEEEVYFGMVRKRNVGRAKNTTQKKRIFKAGPSGSGKRRGRKRKPVVDTDVESGSGSDNNDEWDETMRESTQTQRVPKKRGRKPKNAALSEVAEMLQIRRQRQQSKKKYRPPPTIFTEEELQEERYNDELFKLNCISEPLKMCSVREQPSDNESENDDDTCIEESDDDDDRRKRPKEKTKEVRCPRPGPIKGRGGSKAVAKKVIQLSKEQVEEMSLIIKGSIKKSLTWNRTLMDLNEMKREVNNEIETTLYQTNPENYAGSLTRGSNTNRYITYKSLRGVLEFQNKWIEKKQHACSEPQETFSESGPLCLPQSFPKKGEFEKQMNIEHIAWLCSMAKEGDSPSFAKFSTEGILTWFVKFSRRYNYPGSMISAAEPCSGSTLDLSLKMVTVKCYGKLQRVLNSLVEARAALETLFDLMKSVSKDKRGIEEELEATYERMSTSNPILDEFSIWGLKPIRLALEPPYFKSADGMLAAPMGNDAIERHKHYFKCFYKRDKQKWTTKDLRELRDSIEETLVTKRLNRIENRYSNLMDDCYRRYAMQMSEEGRFDAPERVRTGQGQSKHVAGDGRPRKSELEVSTYYGTIYPVLTVCNGIIVRYEVTPQRLAEWRTNEETKLKRKTYEQLVFMENEEIDWEAVANKMVTKSRKNRSSEDCELAWRHEVHPHVNDKRWKIEDSKTLATVYEKLGNNDWSLVADELNKLTAGHVEGIRTPYQCFFRIRNKIAPPKKIEWNQELNAQVLDELKKHPGNWRIVAASLNDIAATKRQCIERYKKTINPVLRSGPFTRVEDCLLILTIEKLKPFLAREGHFGCLLAYLPWRCETTWRDRANNLFSDWIVPWTLEEDKMLLELAETMNRNWQQISEEFTSFKNRKGCLTRYKILNARLESDKFDSLEAYHEAYSMTRYNVFQYKHLTDVLKLLQRVRDKPLPPEFSKFVGLMRDEKPSDVRLQHMLLTFDRDVLNSTISSLSNYIQTRDNYWRNWIDKHGEKKRTFDRRTFHPDNPQSVASALHIQGLDLKNKDKIPNLNDFEKEIYKFYARFTRTKALAKTTDRPYIPDAKTLARWSVVSRIIATPVQSLPDKPIKKKWKYLLEQEVISAVELERDRNRKRNVSGGSKKRGPKPKQRKAKAVESCVNSPARKKRPYKRRSSNTNQNQASKEKGRGVKVQSNPEGYILIPSANGTRKRHGRGKKSRDLREREIDPDFDHTMVDEEPEDSLPLTNQPIRRSSRVRKKKCLSLPQEDIYDFNE